MCWTSSGAIMALFQVRRPVCRRQRKKKDPVPECSDVGPLGYPFVQSGSAGACRWIVTLSRVWPGFKARFWAAATE